ncbi:response regulator, partial [bacterium]|nr:response regulator [candidate division CSSED10-310 bacterium]
MTGESILLVESNDNVTNKFAEALHKAGFHISSVKWAEEALTLIQNDNFDVILMRTKLPGMNAFKFTQELRRDLRFRIRPLVFIYGKDDYEHKMKSFKSGADEYLVLPFPLPELSIRLKLRLQKTIKTDSGI